MELQDNEDLEFAMGGLDIGPNGDGECLEDDTSLAGNDHTCSICMEKYHNPRVLSCLHTFCLPCLETMQKMLMDESGDGVKAHKNIQCPKCKQETKVGSKGVSSLPIDHVMCNMLEMSAITCSAVKCQSCKTKEPAVARCADCANCLCANCNSAHEFMHRFEKHEVVKLEDLCAANGGPVPIHASIVCKKHMFANMTYYCHTCQMPMCNSCALEDHASPDHHYESLAEAEPRLRENIQHLTDETMAKGDLCVKTSNVMTNELQELQVQTDNARSSITEAMQSYKAIVEKYCQELEEQLMNLHHTRELKIMESFHILDCTQGKIDSAAKFATRLLKNGNMVELASLNGVVVGQLQNLIDNIPKPEVFPAIEFKSNLEEFESGVKAVLGTFRGFDEPEPATKESTGHSGGSLVESAASPSSSVLSMQSSLEGSGSRQSPPLAPPALAPTSQVDSPAAPTPEAVGIGPPVAALEPEMHSQSPPQGFPHEPPVSGSSLNLTCMGEYNLQQLANLSTPNSTSPNPPFPFPEPFAGPNSTFMKNLEALAQVGHATVNGTSPSPPATLGALMNDVMMSDHMANGMSSHGAMILGRASPSLDMNVALMGGSPGIDMMNSMRTSPQGLEINTTMGNITLRSLSGTPSPILSQPDTIDLESMRSLSLSTVSMNSINSFQPRAMNGKLNPMQIRCKYGQLGPSKAQFNSPHGFCLGADEDIIVADTNNHRIQIFDKNGAYKFQFGIPGKEEGQLWYPRKVAVMRTSGKFVVCDRGNERSRMQIFTRNGHFVKKIAIRYVDIVAGLAVTVEGNIVAVDSVSPTVFVISESGELIRWFDCSDHMREPSDIAINGNEYFVCDFKGHCVVVFSEEGTFLRRIGCESITNFPNGIDISDAGDVLVGDSHGNRFHVAVFTRDGSLLSEFECPYVKVSRCCGLKITSEGYIVTLAKNNHHVLILNTLYIV